MTIGGRYFLCNWKLRFHYIKKLREDRTAADKKYVAYCDPPQAENLASEILFYRKLCEGNKVFYKKGSK